MIRFVQLRLKRHIVFRKLVWQLDKHPLTVIRGLNRDRGQSSNAVGKSLIPASIATLLTDAPPITSKRKSARDLVYGRSQVELDLVNDKTNWSLRQAAKGNSIAYDIWQNGQSLQVNGIRHARELIKQAFPLSVEQFYSQVLISSYRPPVLLYGQAAARLEFFEAVFDLQVYDMMRRSLLTDLRTINHKFAQAELLQAQQQELANTKRYDLSADIEKIRQQHKQLLQRYQQTNEQIQQLTAYTTLAEQLHSNTTLLILQKRHRRLRNNLRGLQRRVSRMHRVLGTVRSQRKILRQRQLLVHKLHKLPKRFPLGLTQCQRKLQQKIARLTTWVEQYQVYEKYIERYHKIVDSLIMVKQSTEQLQKQHTEIHYQLSQQRKLHAGKPCPVCGQLVARKQHYHKLKKLRRNIRRINNKLHRARRLRFCTQLRQRVLPQVIRLNINKAQRQLINWQQREKIQQQQLRQRRKRRDLLRQLQRLPQLRHPKQFNQAKLIRLEQQRDTIADRLQTTQQDIKLLHKLAELDVDYANPRAAKRALYELQSVVQNLSPRLQKISDKMHQFTAQQSEYVAAKRQLHKIKTELAELTDALDNKIIVEALVQAYSTKGIRLMQVRSLAKVYSDSLNDLAPSIYAEPYKFFTDVSPNKFDIMVQRHRKISDIRSLSGSESRQFMPISALALIKLMPQHLRCSHIFLDEIEYGLSRTDRQLLVTKFFPLLANSVPYTVIITPYSIEEMSVIDATDLVVERQQGFSQWQK